MLLEPIACFNERRQPRHAIALVLPEFRHDPVHTFLQRDPQVRVQTLAHAQDAYYRPAGLVDSLVHRRKLYILIMVSCEQRVDMSLNLLELNGALSIRRLWDYSKVISERPTSTEKIIYHLGSVGSCADL